MSQEVYRMPAHLILYEVLRAGPEIQSIREVLNEAGRRGYILRDTRANSDGVYTFILSKDTGIIAEEHGEAAGDWIADGFVNEETAWNSDHHPDV